MYMMSAAWASLAIVLSALGAVFTWFAWKRQGLRGLVRGVAITLMPIALWLTGTLRLVAAISDWLVSWSSGLVFSPSVIVGTVLFVVSVVLFGAAGRITGRERAGRSGRAVDTGSPRGAVAAPKAKRNQEPAVRDDDMDEIEALLRQRGIR